MWLFPEFMGRVKKKTQKKIKPFSDECQGKTSIPVICLSLFFFPLFSSNIGSFFKPLIHRSAPILSRENLPDQKS